MTRLLLRAIRERRIVEFDYDRCHRVVEPHVLGVLGGVDQLLGYQIGWDRILEYVP